MKAGVEIKEKKIKKTEVWSTLGLGMLEGALEGVVGAGAGKLVSKAIDLVLNKKKIAIKPVRRWSLEFGSGLAIDYAIDKVSQRIKKPKQ
jgi:hypothetical protein